MSGPGSKRSISTADTSSVDARNPPSLSGRSSRILLALIVLWGLLGSGWVATVGLDSRQWWDERYVFENVRPVLEGQGIAPVNGWYPRLSYLPQTALLSLSQAVSEVTGAERLAVFQPDGSFSPAAYLISRWLNTLFAAGCLLVVFLIGKRLFSPTVGVLAAFLLSVVPWHIHAAGVFKPDPLLLLLISATFYWSLGAIEQVNLRTYLLCGAGVGLAASAKTPGAFAAIPLVVLTLLEPRRRSRWVLLAAAGATSILVFWLINADPLYYLRFAQSEQEWLTGNHPERSPVETFLWVVSMPADWSFHGPILGPVAVMGLAGLAILLARRWGRPVERLRLAIFLSPVLLYPAAISALTDYWKGNYVMPLLPYLTIGLAWMLTTAWRWVAARLPANWRRLLVWPAVLVVVIVAGRPGLRYVYRGGVPITTTSQITQHIRATTPLLNHRTVVHESGLKDFLPTDETAEWRTIAVTREETALSSVPTAELDRADYEVFAKQRLDGPDREFYLGRTSRLDPEQVAVYEPKLFSVRGPAQVLLTHPWRLVGQTLPLDQADTTRRKNRSLKAPIPGTVRVGETISLDLGFGSFEPPSLIARDCRLRLDGASLEIFPYQVHGDVERWMTKRFTLERRRARVELRCGKRSPHLDRLSVFGVVRWAPNPPGAS